MNDRKIFKKTHLSYIIEDKISAQLICAFSKRIFNYDLRILSGRKEKTKRIKARKKFFESLKIVPENSIFLEQPHKANVLKATANERGRGFLNPKNSVPGYDAALTNEPEVALCLLTADCLPMIFFEPRRKIIGIAHAGWRGSFAKIALRIVKQICQQFQSSPADINVYIGPGIRECCYEIGADFKRKFPSAIVQKKDNLYLDLAKANINQLIAAGVKRRNIFDAHLCTSCKNDEFFSYRCGDEHKRMLTVVMLKDRSAG